MARRSAQTTQNAENTGQSATDHQWDEPEGSDKANESKGDGQLSEADLDALDPLTREQHLDEAARRNELPNRQTTAEFETGKDAVSGTQNPGIIQNSGHTHQGPETDTDMSGRRPFKDPAGALDSEQVEAARKALTRAENQDINNIPETHTEAQKVAARRSAGWRSLRDLEGVHATTLAALVKDGRVEQGHAPGMHHSAEAGALFRIKRARD